MAMKIEIYTLTSSIHDQEVVDRTTKEFLDQIAAAAGCEFVMKGQHFEDYGEAAMPLIYVRTGGTEAIFKQVEHLLFHASIEAPAQEKIRLLTSGKSNSLAASMEILSYLNQNGRKGEILHGSPAYIVRRICSEFQVETARKALWGTNLGVIGKPSDWLIASDVDRDALKRKLGINLIDIPIQELVDTYQDEQLEDEVQDMGLGERISTHFDKEAPEKLARYKEGSFRIYRALDRIVRKYDLKGFTLRCFDLLTALENTGCMALALFNSRGIPACCEGDIPAMITMAVGNALTGFSGFQANPSRIDPETDEMTLAHCTVPLNMVRKHAYDTHFESGIGVAVRGELPEGTVTIVKFSGQLDRIYVKEAELVRNLAEPDLCRTQIVIKGKSGAAEGSFADYFLKNPIGNHHLVFIGNHKNLFEAFFNSIA